MTGWQHFTLDNLPVSAWRTGGGETREIISYPPGKREFDWRISIATIEQDGPFSAFPGIDRSITLLSGEGVHLRALPGIDHALTRVGEPYAFRGDDALRARLLGGVTTDFNVMTRRLVCAAHVITTGENLRVTRETGGVSYIIRGEWQIPDRRILGAGEGLVWSDADGCGDDAERSFTVTASHPDGLLLWAAVREQKSQA